MFEASVHPGGARGSLEPSTTSHGQESVFRGQGIVSGELALAH